MKINMPEYGYHITPEIVKLVAAVSEKNGAAYAWFMDSPPPALIIKNRISYVSFDFEEGDHAVPGVYSRDAWSFN